MVEEIWKPILGYESYYEISNLGRVKSLARYTTKPIEEKILCDECNRVGLVKNGVPVYFKTRVLVAESFLSKPSKKHTEVVHKDGDTYNNNVSNLEWCIPPTKEESLNKRREKDRRRYQKLKQSKIVAETPSYPEIKRSLSQLSVDLYNEKH